MKRKLLYLLFFTLCICRVSAQNFEWAKSFGGTEDDFVKSMKIDASGNIYTTGIFKGTVDFDPSPSATFYLTSNGDDDFYIQKLDADGNFLWAKSFGGNERDESVSLSVDNSGNVYTTGYFKNTVDFDPSSSDTFNLTSTGYIDIYIQKLDTDGNFIWAKSFGGSAWHHPHSLSLDNLGNIYTIGEFRYTVDLDPSPSDTFNLTTNGYTDIFIQKLDADGNFLWAKSFGGSDSDEPHSLSVDNSGNVYTAGYFKNTVDFDPSSSDTFNLTSTGHTDIFIQKLDTDGNFLWVKSIGEGDLEEVNSLSVDNSGNVYTTGEFRGMVDFDPDPITTFNFTGSGLGSIFIHKLDTDGNFIWAKSMGSNCSGHSSIAVDNSGNIYTTGLFEGMVDFDPSPSATFYLTSTIKSYYDSNNNSYTNYHSNDVYIQKLDPDGNFIWAKSYGDSDIIGGDLGWVNLLSVDNSGNIYTAGYLWGTLDFDPSPSATFYLTSNGYYDIFIQKLSSIISSVTIPDATSIIKAYPNPSSDRMTIDLDQSYSSITVDVHNVLGQLIRKHDHINVRSLSLDLPVQKGVYFLTLSTDDKHLGTVKVLKE